VRYAGSSHREVVGASQLAAHEAFGMTAYRPVRWLWVPRGHRGCYVSLIVKVSEASEASESDDGPSTLWVGVSSLP